MISIDLHQRLDEAAVVLHRNLGDGYTPGLESLLARNAVSDHLQTGPDGVLHEALRDLVHDHFEDLITVDCLLSELDDGSYQTVDVLTDTLVDTVLVQGQVREVVERLATAEIVRRARIGDVIAASERGGK